jgi:tetratricopeptide (TPR) repeat protein
VIGLADRSIAIDPDNSRAYATKSIYLTTIEHRPVEGLRAADAGLAANQNDAPLHAARAVAENYLGHFQEGLAEAEQAMRLSPRDQALGPWHSFKSFAELGLGNFDAAIEEAGKAIDAGYRIFWPYTQLTIAHALKGNLEAAKTALTEARRLNPKLTVENVHKYFPDFLWMVEGMRKAGLPEQ